MDESTRKHRLRDAAIEAEFDTGRREDTVEEARASILVRLARISVGIAITIVGIIMLPLPGPGLVIIAFGLAVLAKDVPWARRIQNRVQERIPKNDAGKVPKWMVALGVVALVVAVGMSVAFTVYSFSSSPR